MIPPFLLVKLNSHFITCNQQGPPWHDRRIRTARRCLVFIGFSPSKWVVFGVGKIRDLETAQSKPLFQWEFQDPKMEVLYHIRLYFVGIFPYIGLIYGRYLQFRFLKWPLIKCLEMSGGTSTVWLSLVESRVPNCRCPTPKPISQPEEFRRSWTPSTWNAEVLETWSHCCWK